MSEELAPVCILAGGLGTRLGDQAERVPKALIEVAGAPFIFHQLTLLRSYGARRIVVCIGHLGEQIEQTVGDGGELGLDVSYSHDGPAPVGTAGAIRQALPDLGEFFLVLYGDTFLRIDYRAVQRAFESAGLPALMTVLRNQGRWDTSNTNFAAGRVITHDKRHPTPDMHWIDYGLGVMSAAAMRGVRPEASDLSDVYGELARRGELAGFEATERFYEIGTPGALAETDAFLRERAGGLSEPPQPR
ncbi:MAG: sugar phosphate nucleotidyltransferase [Solirubrobacteraceae bacterium]